MLGRKRLYIFLFTALFFSQCKSNHDRLLITAANDLNIERKSETIELRWQHIIAKIPTLNPGSIELTEQASGAKLISQTIDYDQDGSVDALLFQADFAPKAVKTFVLQATKEAALVETASKTYAKFVPTRFDDFAWENDRIAFRMYGPALQAKGEINSGVDVWVKSVPNLVLDKWYAPDYGSYHEDKGEGLDHYKVGPSRGCGGLAIWADEKMIPSKNFIEWKIIANGPIRTVFELTYAPWEVAGDKISEIKRITLDAGQNLNRFESTFKSAQNRETLPIAIGIVKRDKPGDVSMDTKNGVLRYWQPAHEKHGHTGCGVVIAPAKVNDMKELSDHFVVSTEAKTASSLTYYAGAGWSKNADFPTLAAWDNYLAQFSAGLASPLRVEF